MSLKMLLYVFLSLTTLHVATGAADYSWVRGVNYVPSTAHNDVATFQDYNKTLVERELGFARRSGFNAVRTFLSTLPYFYNPTAFLSNLAHFVQTLEALNLTSQLVVFDSCFGNTTANETWITSGQYKNATWIPNPGPAKIADNSTWPALVQYVTDVARTVGTSKAVLLWDIHNEPNFALPNILPFISFMTQALLAVDPGARPITSGIASASQQPLVQSIVTALSFHSYDGGGGGKDLRATIEEQQALAASLGKGVLLTEAMSRPSDLLGAVLPAVTGCLTTPPTPPMGFFLWELMLGVDQFNYNWDMPFQGLVNPDASANPPWRRTPGTWWRNEEQELFQAYFPPAAASYTLQSSRCPSPSNATSFLPDTCPCMDYSPAEDWTAWSGVGPQPQGTLHYSNTLSTAEVTLPLGTTQVWLVYKSGPDCGLFDVYLDGTLVAPQVDSFTPSVDWDSRVLLGKDLSGTMEHSALVVASGKGNPLSSNTYTQIVGFEVKGGFHYY